MGHRGLVCPQERGDSYGDYSRVGPGGCCVPGLRAHSLPLSEPSIFACFSGILPREQLGRGQWQSLCGAEESGCVVWEPLWWQHSLVLGNPSPWPQATHHTLTCSPFCQPRSPALASAMPPSCPRPHLSALPNQTWSHGHWQCIPTPQSATEGLRGLPAPLLPSSLQLPPGLQPVRTLAGPEAPTHPS